MLGDLPERNRPVKVLNSAHLSNENYEIEKLLLDLNGKEAVPAYFIKPRGAAGKLPAILYNHSHGGLYKLGKDEVIKGVSYETTPPYAEALTKMGYAVLCIDNWGFGERSTLSENEIALEMLWKGEVLWGMRVYDSIKAVDYLVSRPDVDASKIGTIGMSMGSTMAWWVAALDIRIKVCVDICCLTDFQTLIEKRNYDMHGLYYYVPGLFKYFTTPKINGLIAPRAHLGLAGNRDELTPRKGLDRIDAELKIIYSELGVPDAWKLLRYDVGHQETTEMRREILKFFKEKLQ